MITPRGRDLAVWVAVFTFLTLVSVYLRFYTIVKVRRRPLRTDDFLIIAAVAVLIANEALVFWEIANGLGAHTADLPWDVVTIHIKATIGYSWTWTIATTLCKLSILFLYLELFGTNKAFRRVIWALILLNVIFPIVFIILFNTPCSKLSDSWDPILSQTQCRSVAKEEVASVGATLGLDLCVVMAPIPIIWRLQMPLKKKVAVCSMFSLGLGVVAIMTWRVIRMSKSTKGIAVDLVYDNYLLLLQSNLELWLGILAANIPSLAPILDGKAFSKISEYINLKSSSSSWKRTPPVPLITFGGSGTTKRPVNTDFEMMEDDSETPFHGQIMRNQSFEISSQHPSDSHISHGYSVSIS
ncbi:hypothetical protein F4779DRAFT_148648 [Xylariaceae sp. FL0662B]|nr:hypothetical protein F4779DRAFT_148648 [Xylariaceae sp. FL0662B]